MGRVEGKVALVTGAARGQGRSHAVRLAEEGADVIVVDLCDQVDSVPYDLATPADLDETVRQIETHGRRARSAVADVRDGDGLRRIVEGAVAELGRLDVIVANAGVFSFGSVLELTDQQWCDVIDINLTGVWRTCVAAIPSMIAAGNGGSVILTSSAGGLSAFRNCAHYVASKFGVIGLMQALALELGEHGIRVNAIAPTTVATPMVLNEPTFKLFAPRAANPSAEDLGRAVQRTHALPTPWVEADDISNAVLYLASADGRFVTGVALPIDAGLLIKR